MPSVVQMVIQSCCIIIKRHLTHLNGKFTIYCFFFFITHTDGEALTVYKDQYVAARPHW